MAVELVVPDPELRTDVRPDVKEEPPLSGCGTTGVVEEIGFEGSRLEASGAIAEPPTAGFTLEVIISKTERIATLRSSGVED